MSNGSQMSCLARHGRPRQSRSKALCEVVSNELAAGHHPISARAGFA
jgi:hypothetical protein